MAPAWWITYVILALYSLNSVWLLYLGMRWAALYWFAAALITIAAMNGFTQTSPGDGGGEVTIIYGDDGGDD